jgi:hypothetical protein
MSREQTDCSTVGDLPQLRPPYLAGATVGFQERLAARRLGGPTLSEVHQLFGTVAEGNTVVIQQELATRGIQIDLRTLQRAVATLRQEERARALGTVRFETPPGQQIQIDFGEKVVQIADQPVKIYLMTAVLGHSRRLYCRAFLAQRQDDWLEGLEGAFQHFGGLTEQVLCDNASPLVTSHDRQSGQVVWNPGFETFCRDRGLTAKGGERGHSRFLGARKWVAPLRSLFIRNRAFCGSRPHRVHKPPLLSPQAPWRFRRYLHGLSRFARLATQLSKSI